MDFGIGNRVAPVGVVTVAARSDANATQGSVAVDLPAEQTVQSAQAGAAVKVDVRQRQARDETRRETAAETRVADDGQARRREEQSVRDVIDSRLIIEPRTRTVVLQTTNRDTGETVALVPDEATLRRRIMARAVADSVRDAQVTARYVERTA